MMENRKKAAFRYAFPRTVPVMVGYLFLGTAYGILMKVNGYGCFWALAMSLLVYAGSLQYVGVTLLASMAHPLYGFLMGLMINARHLFYGISMLGRYRSLKRFRTYLIFSLTDETFSVVCSEKIPDALDREWVYLWISLLNQAYWVAGSVVRSIQQVLINKHIDKMDFEEVIKKNSAKSAKKLEKMKQTQERMNAYATIKGRNIQSTGQQNGANISTNAKPNGKSMADKASVNASAGSVNTGRAKPGSMLEKANLVKDYNERNNKN